MFVNFASLALETVTDLKHFQIMQGSKWYGNHLGPYKTPAKEDDPGHLPPNFYFNQQEWLTRQQQGQSWTWSALRPHGICGFTTGSSMNQLTAVALYAAICKYLGRPLRFPGKPGAFDCIYQFTEAAYLARGMIWAATNPAWAALASERAATQFGLHIVAHAIQDDAYNRTRFAIICLPHTLDTPPPSDRDCTSLIVSVPNKPGAVHDLLVPLKKHGVSMTRFESRPARTGQWEYYFYIDIDGHPSQPHVSAALNELRSLCAFYKVLGTYPVTP